MPPPDRADRGRPRVGSVAATLFAKYFIVFFFANLPLAVHAAYALAADRPARAFWLAVLLAHLPGFLFLAVVGGGQSVARMPVGMWAMVVPAVLGATASLGLASAGQYLWAGLAVLAGAIATTVYAFVFSQLARGTARIAVGEYLPSMTLYNTDGAAVTTADLLGSPGALIFYRGAWCPFCVAQIKEVTARYNDIAALGAQVYFVSAQHEKASADLAKRFAVKNIRFLIDRDLTVTTALGLLHHNGIPIGMEIAGHRAGDTSLPSVIVFDRSGRVALLDETETYTRRPEPDLILDALKRVAA